MVIIWVGLDLKHAKDFASVMERSGVAAVPEGARNVRTKVVANRASWSAFLTFEAEPSVIDAFLTASPGTEGGFQARIGVNEPYVSCDEIRDPSWWLQRCYLPVTAALWWEPTVRIDGRLYELPGNSPYARGTIVIDDEAGRVWAHFQRP